MTPRVNELLREALRLTPEERADVAAELLASLDDVEDVLEDVQAAWAAEIERRAARAIAGESSGMPLEDVRCRAEMDIGKR